jgi:hypothetical protein
MPTPFQNSYFPNSSGHIPAAQTSKVKTEFIALQTRLFRNSCQTNKAKEKYSRRKLFDMK